jgi:hypothetical protein
VSERRRHILITHLFCLSCNNLGIVVVLGVSFKDLENIHLLFPVAEGHI